MSTNKSLDSKLNKTALDCVLFSAVGLGIGVVASLFFKNKASIRANFVGLGAGIALSQNMNYGPSQKNQNALHSLLSN